MLTVWVAVLQLLNLPVSGLSQHAAKAPSLPPSTTATSISGLPDQDTDCKITNTPGSHDEHEHIDNIQGQVTILTLVQHIPVSWVSVRTLETITKENSRHGNTFSPRSPSQDGNGEDGISGSANAPTAGRVHDLKRSAGIFVIIKATLVSWAILLVGMLTYMVARYAEEVLSEELRSDTEPIEDHEQTALLDHEDV